LSDPNSSKLSSIKTYLLIALIFNILAVIGFAVATFAFLFLFFLGLIFLVPLILSVLTLTRVNSMKSAAERGDVAKLKELNSLGWAIIALLFAGIITGIMLIITNGAINDLNTSPQPMQSSQLAQAGMKYCANCGTQMPAATAFCPKCGAKQPV
jgi:putative membrane protein